MSDVEEYGRWLRGMLSAVSDFCRDCGAPLRITKAVADGVYYVVLQDDTRLCCSCYKAAVRDSWRLIHRRPRGHRRREVVALGFYRQGNARQVIRGATIAALDRVLREEDSFFLDGDNTGLYFMDLRRPILPSAEAP